MTEDTAKDVDVRFYTHEHDFVQGMGSAEWLLFCRRCGMTQRLAPPEVKITNEYQTNDLIERLDS